MSRRTAIATVSHIGKDVPLDIALPLLQQRFAEKSNRMPNGCWEWPGYILPNGYPEISAFGCHWRANRLSYFAFNNGNLPDDKEVMHTCDNTLCVNPEHLTLGSGKQNIQDSIAKGRRNTARKPTGRGHPAPANRTHCIHGHEFNEANTYITPVGHRQCRTCHQIRVHKWKPKRRSTAFDADSAP